jgi:hypothetical protein
VYRGISETRKILLQRTIGFQVFNSNFDQHLGRLSDPIFVGKITLQPFSSGSKEQYLRHEPIQFRNIIIPTLCGHL